MRKRAFLGAAVRNQYLLHYVISGCGTYVVGGETYTLHAGSCFLIRPGERTLYTADRKDRGNTCGWRSTASTCSRSCGAPAL